MESIFSVSTLLKNIWCYLINGWWKIEFTGVTDPSEHSLEHIAGLIKEGYTSGQILEEPQASSSKDQAASFKLQAPRSGHN